MRIDSLPRSCLYRPVSLSSSSSSSSSRPGKGSLLPSILANSERRLAVLEQTSPDSLLPNVMKRTLYVAGVGVVYWSFLPDNIHQLINSARGVFRMKVLHHTHTLIKLCISSQRHHSVKCISLIQVVFLCMSQSSFG